MGEASKRRHWREKQTQVQAVSVYIVWNYRTPKARPILYGIGEFRSVQTDVTHTQVTWTYSFKLREDVFPGNLGALGRWLFRVAFLDGQYADMMRGVLNGYKQAAENF